MTTVTVYSTGHKCVQCDATYRRLDACGIPFHVEDISCNETAREYVTDELGYSQAPVVVVDDEPQNHWSGFRPDLIDRLASRIGSRS